MVDDERPARELLCHLLKTYCKEVELIGEASNIHDAELLIERLHPDLVFLDTDLGNDSGFNLLENLMDFNFSLIFTAAHSECAVKAFRVNAIDYLLKPIDPKQLTAAIRKVKNTSSFTDLNLRLQTLAHTFNPTMKKHLAISSIDGVTFIDICDIVRIEG